MRLVQGYADQLPKMKADRSLRAITELGVGFGTLKQRDEIVREWRELAGIRGRRLSTVGEVALAAASIGFQVVRDIPPGKKN